MTLPDLCTCEYSQAPILPAHQLVRSTVLSIVEHTRGEREREERKKGKQDERREGTEGGRRGGRGQRKVRGREQRKREDRGRKS